MAAPPERAPRAARARLSRWLIPGALLALTAYGAWVRWRLLAASPYPLGVDGYYYPIQLRSLLEHGHLYYPASPLAFWLMAPLAALTDPITGAKLGAALAGALVVWPAYAVGARLAGPHGRWLAGLAAALVAVTSTGSLLLSAEFVKNAFGVTVGLAALAAALAAAEELTRRRLAVAAVAALAAVLTHKVAAALVVALGLPPLLVAGWRAAPASRRRRLLVAAGLVAAGLGFVGALAPDRFLSLAHLPLLRGALGGAWRWDAPALALRGFELPLDGEGWKAGAACALAALLMLAARRGARHEATDRGATTIAAALVLALGGLIAWPGLAVDDPQGLGFRLRLVAFVPLALAVAIACAAALTLAPARARRAATAAVAVALALWIARAPTSLARGVVYAHPAMISAVLGLRAAVPSGDTVVVSERHLMFLTTWYTRVRTSVRQDAAAPARRWRLMPLAFIGLGSPLARAIDEARRQPDLVAPRGLHPNHHDGLVLMPEATWQWILTRLPPAPRARYAAWPTL